MNCIFGYIINRDVDAYVNKSEGAFLLEVFRGLEQKESSWYDAGCQISTN